MTKIKHLLLAIAVIAMLGIKAQNISCTTSQTLTIPVLSQTIAGSSTSGELWYTFQLGQGNYTITAINLNSPATVTAANVYDGSCGSLNFLQTDSLLGIADFVLNLNFTDNGPAINTYFLKLKTTNLLTDFVLNIEGAVSTPTWICPSTGPCINSSPCELVCNGGFEAVLTEPYSHSQLPNAYNWNNANTGTADLFSANVITNTVIGIPCNFAGSQNSNAPSLCNINNHYIGILNETYSADFAEYVETKLNSNLTAGQQYLISFYVSKGENFTGTLNSLGIWLTQSPIVTNNFATLSNILYPPSGVYSNTVVLNDNTSWNKISFCYVANGTENYLTIGRPQGSSVPTGSTPATFACSLSPIGGLTYFNYAQTYIDEVSVIPTNLTASPSQTIEACSTTTVFASMTCSNLPTPSYTWYPVALTGSAVAVTPTANTVYTVTAQTDACVSQGTVAVTTVIVLNVNFTYNDNNGCPIKLFNAYSNACPISEPTYTFSWNFGDGNTGTGISPTHTYVLSGIYSVTLTVTGPGGPIVIVQNVNVNNVVPQPGITAIASPSVICPGSSGVLFASGGASGTYTWFPLNAPVDYVIVTPSVTTNYTLVGNNINGCQMQTTVTLIVHNEPPVISLTPSFVCLPNNSVTLNVSGIIGDYILYSPPVPPLVTVLSSSIILSPTVTSIYTVEATNLYGCVITSTFQIGVVPCACLDDHGDELSGVISSSLSPNTPYKIVNNLTVGLGFIGFNNNDILIYPGVKVTVPSNALLNIIASHLHGCGELWDGIEVQASGQLLVSVWGKPAKTTLIEDANVAINVLDDNAPYPGGLPNLLNTLRVDRATFNKNIIGIKIGKYQRDDPNYPFTIDNCLFTSRDIPFVLQSWPTTNTVKNSASGGSSMQTPYIDNTSYPPVAITSTLYSYNGYPNRGIEINDVGYTLQQLVGGVTTYQFKGIQIGQTGQANFNCFDNLRTDIYCSNTNLTISNSVFQTGQRFGPSNLQGGRGIVAFSSFTPNTINKNSISISYGMAGGSYSCRFYEKTGSADIFDYFNVEVLNTESYSDLNNYNQLNLSNTFGGLGFNIQTNRYMNINLQNNQLYNIKNAMLVGLNNLPSGGNLIRELGQILVIGNTVDRWLGIGGVAPYVNIAVSITDPLASANYTIPYNNNVAIANNTFTRVNNGISVMNMVYSPVSIDNNTVTMVNEPPTFSISPVQRGIYSAQCLKSTKIGLNTITGPSVWGQEMRALSTAMNTSLAVRCNTTSNVERGIEFSGTQTTDFFEDNWMTNETYGLVLDNNAVLSASSTVIGTPIRPTDNVWDGTWTTPNFKTNTEGGSTAQNSKLYIQYANPLLNPASSGTTSSVFNICPAIDAYTICTLFPLSSTLFNAAVSQNPTCRLDDGGGGGGSGSARMLLEEAVTDAITYTANSTEALHINKTAAYRTLKSNPEIMVGSNILNTFYNAGQNNYLQSMVNIEHNLANNNINTAQNQIASLTPANAIETNYKKYYQVLRRIKDNNYDNNDSLILISLANKCPYTEGAVVYQARALYNIKYSGYYYFYDNCSQQNIGGRTTKQTNNKQEEVKVVLKSTLYPNPNDGNYVLRFSNSVEKQSVEISIFDITGRQVIKESRLVEANKELDFSNNLLNGSYLVKVKLADGTIDVHRLIISK